MRPGPGPRFPTRRTRQLLLFSGKLLLSTIGFLILIEVGLRVVGFVFAHAQERANREAVAAARADAPGAGETAVVLCIGESTTALGGADAYPKQLEDVLVEWGGGRRFAVVNRGVPGGDSSTILAQLESNLETWHPDVVVAMMGANDRGGAIPFEGLPVAEQRGFPYFLKTWKLWRQLRHASPSATEPEGGALASSVDGVPSLGKRDPAPAGGQAKKGSPKEIFDAKSRGPKGMRIPERPPPGLPAEFTKAWDLARDGQLDAAISTLRALLAAHPDDAPLVRQIGLFFEQRGLYDDAGVALEASVAADPASFDSWLSLGRHYEQILENEKSESALRLATGIAPKNAEGWAGLGRVLWKENEFSAAAAAYEAAVKLDPENAMSHGSLGICYDELERLDQARVELRKAVDLDPSTRRYWIRLADFYENHGGQSEAEALFAEIQRLEPDDDFLAGRAELYYLRTGDRVKARAWAAQADAIRDRQFCSATHDAYQALLKALAARSIPLVAVQYPTRPVEPLKRLFEDQKGVYFVDNEVSFRERLQVESYDSLFWDNCYGDFGHCTRLGNRILAENVARVLLGEWLGLDVPLVAPSE
jgi:tetratricopeptide (TPR) repeat protein